MTIYDIADIAKGLSQYGIPCAQWQKWCKKRKA